MNALTGRVRRATASRCRIVLQAKGEQRAAAADMVRHLTGLGHKRIGFIVVGKSVLARSDVRFWPHVCGANEPIRARLCIENGSTNSSSHNRMLGRPRYNSESIGIAAIRR